MIKYFFIGVLIWMVNNVLAQNISTIETDKYIASKKDSIQQNAIAIKKVKWEKKIEELQLLGRKPKIGLVLSGGGAKGFAHIAILQILEKYNITLDYIGGTSVGALLGGLYAVGYNADQIDSMFGVIKFSEFFKNQYSRIEKPFRDRISNHDKYLLSLPFSRKGVEFPISYSNGQKLADVLTHLISLKSLSIHDFSKLSTPFFCIATNLLSGKEKVFNKGYLVEAILASMALPSLFSPISIKDTLFIDGGIVNNLPIEEMKKKNMDLIIAVDISDRVDKPRINSIVTYVDYLFSLMIQNNVDYEAKYVDILIIPNIKKYSSMSFDDGDSIYQKGVEAIAFYKQELEDIAKLCKKYDTGKRKNVLTDLPNNILIDQISVIGSSEAFLKSKKEKVKILNIEESIKKLYATGFYNKIYYTLDILHNGAYKLNVHMEELPYNNFFKIGIHYDQLYSLGVLVNYTAKKKFSSNKLISQIDFSIDAVASNLYRGELHYFQHHQIIPNIGLNAYYAFINPSIYTNLPIENIPNLAFRSINMQMFNVEFYINYIIKQLFAINLGLETQYTSFKISHNPLVFWDKGWNYNFLGSLVVERRNSTSFPSSGILGNVEYKIIPVEIINDFDIVHSLKASIDGYIPIVNNIFSIGLGASAGYLSANLPNYMFSIGGTNSQPYFNNEQFIGYDYASFFTTFYMKGNFGLQIRFYKKHYIQVAGNILTSLRQDVLIGIPKNFVDFDLHYGFGIGYGWDSPIGPIKLSYNYAPSAREFAYTNNVQKGLFFISIGHVF
ncbi:MAG: patatin-like phospholipase family protein [Chitinophagaceae bacterium]